MPGKFYKLPFRFNTVSGNAVIETERCSEKESIDRRLELILTTCPGEHKFNRNFGCRIWEMDFELVFSRKKWEDDFTLFILQAVRNFEPRLKEVNVFLSIREVAREDPAMKTVAVKKKVAVFVEGKRVSDNETCTFRYTLYLGPLSME
ncbi:MAG: GPW/gp25 family protein [Candidatus Symbiothrix sp.]|jgi:phage baseplate assembly protein W|nr:GPW/gp25 family protein [Candidatus Symbiothrix sp.]